MATTIINPSPSNNSSENNGFGFFLGLILIILFCIVFFIFILPLMRGGLRESIQVNVPKDVNVNVQKEK